MSASVFARPESHDESGLVRLFRVVALAVNEVSTIEEAAQVAVDEVCAYTGWDVGHLYLREDGSDELVPTTVWHLSDPDRFEAFRRITEATRFPPGLGLPGRVALDGKPAWSTDVTKDSNFPRAHLGIDIVVRGGFAFPILAGSDLVGVLEFFAVEPKDPDEPFLGVMADMGKLLGWVAERTRAAKALSEQMESTRLVIEAAYDAFVSMDAQGRITAWNAQAEAIFGWSRHEVVGAPLADTIIPAPMREAHRRGLARFLETGDGPILNQRIEVTAMHRDGHEFPVELAVWVVPSGHGMAFHAFVHDITERKRTEEELRLSEERLIHAQEVAAIGSWEWDVEANVVRWSEQLYRNFGVDPEGFGASYEAFLERVHPDDRGDVHREVSAALTSHEPFEFEHRIVRPDRTVRWAHSRGEVAVDDRGRPVRMFGTSQDVSERKRAQEALRTAYERERDTVEKLQELDRAKTAFLSSTSHELRTPLTSIIGYLELLRTTEESELSCDQIQMLDVIDRNSRRLLGLIEDLLTLSQIEAGSFRMSIGRVDVAALVDGVRQAVHPSVTAQALELVVDVPDGVGDIVGDETQLERVLLNVVGNAIKFTPEGGSIELRVRRLDHVVELSVSDTGIGIPSEELAAVFERFHRSSAAHQQAIPGTGLGLSISKTIVEQHAGTIAIASRPGHGTTLTVRLPSASGPLAPERGAA